VGADGGIANSAAGLYVFCAKLQFRHLRASGSKLNSLLPFNFTIYQRFSKVSSCPTRSIFVDIIKTYCSKHGIELPFQQPKDYKY
jgi:hypothetical protein